MSTRIRARLAPYWLILPGWLWLALFFVVPVIAMLSLSTQTGDIVNGFSQTFHWQNYVDGWNLYHVQFIRSIVYGLSATVLCLLIGYPVAYWIAFHGGTRKSSLLFLLLLPFFVSFVIRTVSWQFILADNGMVLTPLRDLHLVGKDFHVLATPAAVVGGLSTLPSNGSTRGCWRRPPTCTRPRPGPSYELSFRCRSRACSPVSC
jgi:spermidine/putrescine transport system permease protein